MATGRLAAGTAERRSRHHDLTLTPVEAVAARITADAPALPRAVTKPTPATMIDVLPLVRASTSRYLAEARFNGVRFGRAGRLTVVTGGSGSGRGLG